MCFYVVFQNARMRICLLMTTQLVERQLTESSIPQCTPHPLSTAWLLRHFTIMSVRVKCGLLMKENLSLPNNSLKKSKITGENSRKQCNAFLGYNELLVEHLHLWETLAVRNWTHRYSHIHNSLFTLICKLTGPVVTRNMALQSSQSVCKHTVTIAFV